MYFEFADYIINSQFKFGFRRLYDKTPINQPKNLSNKMANFIVLFLFSTLNNVYTGQPV